MHCRLGFGNLTPGSRKNEVKTIFPRGWFR
jgi:hypothetical protein